MIDLLPATLVATLAGVLIALPPPAHAQTFRRTPLPVDHPIVGTWRIEVPGRRCHEVYYVRSDGTARVTSGKQIAETEFEISSSPSANGFYRWRDRIVTDNGGIDCMGESSEVGHEATNFIRLHPSGNRFLLCEQENINTCIGPFIRQDDV